jgi:hypothetical protein
MNEGGPLEINWLRGSPAFAGDGTALISIRMGIRSKHETHTATSVDAPSVD